MLVFLAGAVVFAPMIGGAIGSTGTALGYGAPGVFIMAGLGARRWSGHPRGRAAAHHVYDAWPGSAYAQGDDRSRDRRGGRDAALAFADIGTDGAALLPYLILVSVIWAGMRFGTSAAATTGFWSLSGQTSRTSQGFGPFSSSHGSIHAITLQIFLAIVLISSFVVAAMASDLADRNEVHRLLTHQATHDELTGLPEKPRTVR